MYHIGLDIHKRFTFAVAKEEQGEEVASDKFDNSEENFKRFLQTFSPENTQIVMESTGVWEYIYGILENLNYKVKLANPVKTKAIAYAKVKTDSVDAGTLADLSRGNLIYESYIPKIEVRQLRELTRLRKFAAKEKNQVENRLHALLTKRGIFLPKKSLCKKSINFLKESEQEASIKEYLEMIECHRTRLNLIEEKIYCVADKNNDAKLLMTIPGIGPIHAVEIIAEIGDVNRFASGEKLCSYAGLVSSIKQSGSTLRFGGLMKQASRILKHSLIQTSWVAIRTRESNIFKEFYKKLEKKKGKQKAICATARKICCVIFAMLKNQEEFRYS